MLTLRDYQLELSLRLRRAFRTHRVVLMNGPTGCGKTVIAGDIFRRAVDKGIKPVFLTDRKEIANKTTETLGEFGLNVQLINAESKAVWKVDCYVAMVETFYRRCLSGWFPKSKVGLIFCDECHLATFNKVIELFPTPYICGLTATPVSNSFNLNKVYNKIVSIEGGTPRMIEQGYLVPSIDIGQEHLLDLRMQCGEFSVASMRSAFARHDLNSKFMSLWMRHAKDRQTILFAIDIEHTAEMQRYFNDIGVKSCIIHSKIEEEERDRNIELYNNGDIQVLINVDVASKGFDSPITSCVGFHRSTSSMSKWYQAIGRGGRLFNNKKNFITIDTGNNIPRLGSFNDFVDWEHLYLHPEQDIKKQKKIAKKLCPVCYAYISNVFIPTCPVCDTKINIRQLLDLEDHMPEELKNKHPNDMSIEELKIYAKYKGYKPSWVWFYSNQRKTIRGGFRR